MAKPDFDPFPQANPSDKFGDSASSFPNCLRGRKEAFGLPENPSKPETNKLKIVVFQKSRLAPTAWGRRCSPPYGRRHKSSSISTYLVAICSRCPAGPKADETYQTPIKHLSKTYRKSIKNLLEQLLKPNYQLIKHLRYFTQ